MDTSLPWFGFFQRAFQLHDPGYWAETLENTIDRQLFVGCFLTDTILPDHRYTLIEWLISLSFEMHLPASLVLTGISFLDRVCAKEDMPLHKYQFSGLVCLWIADKLLNPEISNDPRHYYYYIPDTPGVPSNIPTCERNAFFMETEHRFLQHLNFELALTVPIHFFPFPRNAHVRQLGLESQENDLNQFNDFCHFLCLVAATDFTLSCLTSPEQTAVAILLHASQFHLCWKIHIGDYPYPLLPEGQKETLYQLEKAVSRVFSSQKCGTPHYLEEWMNNIGRFRNHYINDFSIFELFNKDLF